MLDCICASKLYRASTRKDRINAAFDNPINSELVGQLAKALDEEYQTRDFLVKDHEESNDTSSAPESSGMPDSFGITDNAGGGPSSPPPSRGKSSSPSKPPESNSEPSPESQDSSTSQPSPSDSSASPSSDAGAGSDGSGAASVEESTQLSGRRVVGSHIRSEFADMRQTADQIKGMLNFKDSTQGVDRILCKENELWIYYNDDVNLNNVMNEVIELLNAANYAYLEFNRLARSDNAIVFQIDFRDTNNVMQPTRPQSDKK